MKMSDEPKVCPLCNAQLEERSGTSGKTKWWACTSKFFWATLYKQTVITHYAIVPDDTEYIYLPPYKVTSKFQTGKSIINKLVELEFKDLTKIDSEVDVAFVNTWQFIAETTIIKAAAADKMLERVKSLLVFL